MYVAFGFVLRGAGGIGLSLAFGVIGLILVRVLFFYTAAYLPVQFFVVLWFSVGGIAAGSGAFLGWLDTSTPRATQVWLVSAYIALGLIGAWGGYFYRLSTIENDPGFTSASLAIFALFWATVLTNMLAITHGILKNIRSGWI